jgi:hypothetical protein
VKHGLLNKSRGLSAGPENVALLPPPENSETARRIINAVFDHRPWISEHRSLDGWEDALRKAGMPE